MNVPQELRYSREHEWVRVDGSTARIGITDFAQESLGDVVFVQLPDVGLEIVAGAERGRDRVDQVGLRRLRAGLRGRARGERRAGRRPRAGQPGPLRRRLDPRGDRWPTPPSSTRSWTPPPTEATLRRRRLHVDGAPVVDRRGRQSQLSGSGRDRAPVVGL